MKKPRSFSKASSHRVSKSRKVPVKQQLKKKSVKPNSVTNYYFKKNKAVERKQIEPEETRFILFNKPYQVLSQFSASDDKKTLANFIDIPEVYPAGRLDFDSEGLLILTNNGRLQHRIAHPDQKLAKTYAVQVEGVPTETQLKELQNGVRLKDGLTKPAKVKIMENQNPFPERVPPIRFRKNVTETWIQISIAEGRNRQVRRMTAAVGLPTLRLIRTSVGHFQLDQLQPGEFKEVIPEGL